VKPHALKHKKRKNKTLLHKGDSPEGRSFVRNKRLSYRERGETHNPDIRKNNAATWKNLREKGKLPGNVRVQQREIRIQRKHPRKGNRHQKTRGTPHPKRRRNIPPKKRE